MKLLLTSKQAQDYISRSLSPSIKALGGDKVDLQVVVTDDDSDNVTDKCRDSTAGDARQTRPQQSDRSYVLHKDTLMLVSTVLAVYRENKNSRLEAIKWLRQYVNNNKGGPLLLSDAKTIVDALVNQTCLMSWDLINVP